MGGWVMEQELFAFVFCVKRPSGKTFYSQNGPQEPCVPLKFDCSQIGQMEGPALGVPFSDQAQNVVAGGLTRVFHLDLKKISPSVRYCFKDDSTLRIFRIKESEIKFQDTGSSDSEDDELEILKAQDEDSEVRL